MHWAANHRGPYFLLLVREGKKKGFVSGEWLTKSPLDAEEAEEEAGAYLTDPRDQVLFIDVWSEREEQFVHTFRPKDFGGQDETIQGDR